jgi:hypothetical protein
VRQIAGRLGPDAAIVVTSDHGVTDRGGHAGPEPEVLATPVVYFGPGFPPGPLPPLRQRDVPAMIATALGLELPPPPTAAPVNAVPRRAGFAVLAIAALLCAVRLWSALAAGAGARPHAFWLNLAVWVALALLLLDQPAAAALLALAALAARGARLSRGAPAYAAAPLLALAIGAAVAVARIAAEWRYGTAPFEIPGAGMPLAVAFALAISAPIGCMLRRTHVWCATADVTGPATARRTPRTAPWAGVALAVGVAPAYVLSGQTLSLSSVGVTEAYHVALHGGGVAGAVVVVILMQALPAMALVVGCMLPQNRRLTAAAAGTFFVGISAVPSGEAMASAVILLASDDVRLNSLSLGCLLRAAATLVFLTCGAAVVILARPRPRPRPEAEGAAGGEPGVVASPC